MKRAGPLGVAAGLALLLLCELPWILALVGIGSLGLSGGPLGPLLEGLAVASVLAGATLWIYRRWRSRRAAERHKLGMSG